jgi:hypothetical protein
MSICCFVICYKTLVNERIWNTQSPFYLFKIYFNIILRSINRSCKDQFLFLFPPTKTLFAVLFTDTRALRCQLKNFVNMSSYIMGFLIFNALNLPTLAEISKPFELSYLWAMYMLIMSLGVSPLMTFESIEGNAWGLVVTSRRSNPPNLQSFNFLSSVNANMEVLPTTKINVYLMSHYLGSEIL